MTTGTEDIDGTACTEIFRQSQRVNYRLTCLGPLGGESPLARAYLTTPHWWPPFLQECCIACRISPLKECPVFPFTNFKVQNCDAGPKAC